MKKLILILVLAIAGTAGSLMAQTKELTYYDRQQTRTKTDKTFNIWEEQVNIRSVVQLQNGRMILDLQNVGDYQNFMNMDSILTNFRKDIAFYKDSLEANGAGNVRIDYVMSPEYTFKKIRFKKYTADGEIFVNRSGEVSKLKLAQDTIHIIIEKILYKAKCNISYNVQATFILDNYTDIDKVFADKEEMNRILEKLEKESHSPKENKRNRYPEMTRIYNPYYTGENALKKYNYIAYNSFYGTRLIHKTDYININANIGAGVIMNTIVPAAELGIALHKPWGRGSDNFSFYRLFASSHYFFEKSAEGSFTLKDNYFINFSLGTQYEKPQPDWIGTVTDVGIGYLMASKGNFFKGTTLKLFTDIKLKNGLTFSPEIISTNNFKQFYPGITLKIF